MMQTGQLGENKKSVLLTNARHLQPKETANTNIFGLRGCTVFVGGISVDSKDGEESTPRIFGFILGPPTGVAGEPDDAGGAEVE